MSSNSSASDRTRAIVVLRGSMARAAYWAGSGTVGAHLSEQDRPFITVVPEARGRASAPYDNGALMLVSRPTPMPMRPSLGVYVQENRVLFCVQQRQWRSKPHWFVVAQGVGPVRSTLVQATKAELLAVGHAAHADALNRVLGQYDAEPLDMARGVLGARGLPGADLLDRAPASEARFVAPKARALRRFEKNVDDERVEHADAEGHHG